MKHSLSLTSSLVPHPARNCLYLCIVHTKRYYSTADTSAPDKYLKEGTLFVPTHIANKLLAATCNVTYISC